MALIFNSLHRMSKNGEEHQNDAFSSRIWMSFPSIQSFEVHVNRIGNAIMIFCLANVNEPIEINWNEAKRRHCRHKNLFKIFHFPCRVFFFCVLFLLQNHDCYHYRTQFCLFKCKLHFFFLSFWADPILCEKNAFWESKRALIVWYVNEEFIITFHPLVMRRFNFAARKITISQTLLVICLAIFRKSLRVQSGTRNSYLSNVESHDL